MTQNGMPFALGRRDGGWFGAEARLVRVRAEAGDKDELKVDLGAGRMLTFKKLGKRKAVPAAIVGTYVSADSGATWEIATQRRGLCADVERPADRRRRALDGRGIDADTVEIDSPRQLDHGHPARPSRARHAPARSPPSKSRPAASRRCGSSEPPRAAACAAPPRCRRACGRAASAARRPRRR